MPKVELAAKALCNLNVFALVASMMESGYVYPEGSALATAQKIVDLCLKEQQVQLRIYDKARKKDVKTK